MELAWHITKKDLRALRWPIAAFLALTVLHEMLRVVWPPVMLTLDPWRAQRLETLRGFVPLMRAALFALIAILAVHADSAVKDDAFWLTRPVSRIAMFVSKLLTLTLALILPGLFANVIQMIAFGVPPGEIANIAPEILLMSAAAIAVAMAAAALTFNLRSLAAWGAAALCAAIGIAMLRAPLNGSGPPRMAAHPDPTAHVVALALLAAGCGFAAWHQYRARDRGRSAAAAIASAIAAVVVPSVWPRLPPADPGAWRRTSVERPFGTYVSYSDGPRSVTFWTMDDDRDDCRALVRTTRLQGLQWLRTMPQLAYTFTPRTYRGPLSWRENAFPEIAPGMSPMPLVLMSEEREWFAIVHRQLVIDGSPGQPPRADAPAAAIDCADLDVRFTTHVLRRRDNTP